MEENLFKGKILVIYGARQVGKTTLLNRVLDKNKDQSLFLNCDEPDIRNNLSNKTSTELRNFIGNKKLVIIDEAQRVKDIVLSLKLLIDNFPEMQIVASGSSSFELSNRIDEPLTGRKKELCLFPISLKEIVLDGKSEIEIDRMLESYLIYGMYPKVLMSENTAKAEENIREIAYSYLYKDILQFEGIKKPELVEKILQALALQVGNEVSYTELSQMLSVDKKTVEKYINILEKAFIIFKLSPLSRNLRKEIGKNRKIYFYDLGVRNAIIKNFNPLGVRNDAGAIWENFVIAERIKRNSYVGENPNIFFWRTYDQKEVDYIEEKGGKISGFEIKWREQKGRNVKDFTETYQTDAPKIISRENYKEFLF